MLRLFNSRWPDLVAFALLIVLCWMLARWTWYIVSPDASAEPAAATRTVFDVSAAANSISAANLFGVTQAPRPVEQIVVPTSLNVKLKGVFAADGKQPAYAILNTDSQGDRHIKAGGEIKSGVTLAEIHPRHVVLQRDGVLERVEFEEKAGGQTPARSARGLVPARPGGASASAPAAPVPATPITPAAGNTPPQVDGNFNLNVKPAGQNQYSFSRNELNQALQDPKQLANLGAIEVNPTGGVTISTVPSGSLTQKLGLQPGDVVSRVNGQAVSSNNDLARLYQQFGQVNQITLEATRNGKPLNLNYTVQQ